MLVYLLLTLSLSAPILAQNEPSDVHQTTALPANARFEVMQSELVACRGESVTAVATPKGQKQVYAWRVPAIWTDLLPESHTNDLSATGH
jgi:hypothetical protein